ncbi:hypothetical protein [uncultured Dokdonia sp.]|uniref:hypothetical protein n=1 Tax=uncultured Dokdonia sp. TaxID=575653 RepID=UPI00260AE869|nr:hypothetical protein [uncultured Dokdonia sp.]
MRQIIIIVFVILNISTSYGQEYLFREVLNDFEKNYSNGEISNLYDLAPLLDVEVKISDNLGYHFFESEVRSVAARKIKENSWFVGVDMDSITQSKNTFRAFLDTNKITYNNLIDSYVNFSSDDIPVSYSLRNKAFSKTIEFAFFSYDELKQFDVNEDDYENEVDYYGAILKNADRYKGTDFFTKISYHLIYTKDPKALLYIGSEPYRHRYKYNSSSRNDVFYDIINSYINVQIQVENEEGVLTHLISNDDYANIKSKNYLKYWMNHYKDYAWDDESNLFVNRKEKGKEYNELEMHFNNLYSPDATIAIASFKSILENLVDVVYDLLEIHKLDGYGDIAPNRSLPSFLNKRIEALTKLTTYYNDNNIDYKLSDKALGYIKNLEAIKEYKTLYNYENEIINEINIKDVIALEYALSLQNHENERGPLTVRNSLSRIFDVYYSNNFEEILNDKEQLRHYLKRSRLYDQFGIIGSQNNYLRKFDNLSNEEKLKLKNILYNEEDSDIKVQICDILDLVIIIDGSHGEVSELFQNQINYFFSDLFDNKGKISEVIKPDLIYSLSKNYRKHKRFAFEYINGLRSEKINFSEKELQELFLDYEQGLEINSLFLYEYFKKKLSSKDSLTELDFNRVSGYKYFKKADADLLINNIGKLKTTRRLTYVNFGEGIKSEGFKKLIPKIKHSQDMLEILNQSKEITSDIAISNILSFSFEVKDKADYYKRIIDQTNFLDWLDVSNEELNTDIENQIIKLLKDALENSKDNEYDYRSYYTNLFLFEHRKMKISDKIELIKNIKEEKIKEELLQLVFIKSPKYKTNEVIQGIVDHYDLFSEREIRKHITLNIGIPLSEYSKETIEKLLITVDTHTRKELFEKYSLLYYPDVYNNKKIDFNKINSYLSFDVIMSFIGGHGDNRFDGVLPLLRLLEETFKTTLGFDNNLKYIDISFTTSIKRRCNAWKKFLKEKGLITKELKYPSFQ